MSWAQYMLPGEPKSSDQVWPYGAMGRRESIVVVSVAVAVSLLFLALAGYAVQRSLHLSGWDDYRTGYSTGAAWRAEGAPYSCQDAMTSHYGDVGWPDRQPGWGEFMAGCEDGRHGRDSASWWNMRTHLYGD